MIRHLPLLLAILWLASGAPACVQLEFEGMGVPSALAVSTTNTNKEACRSLCEVTALCAWWALDWENGPHCHIYEAPAEPLHLLEDRMWWDAYVKSCPPCVPTSFTESTLGGSTLKVFSEGQHSADTCGALCLATAGCQGFTIETSGRNCYLMSSASVQPQAGFTAYLFPCLAQPTTDPPQPPSTTPEDPCSYIHHPDKGTSGSALFVRVYNVTTSEECIGHCEARSDCASATLRHDQSACILRTFGFSLAGGMPAADTYVRVCFPPTTESPPVATTPEPLLTTTKAPPVTSTPEPFPTTEAWTTSSTTATQLPNEPLTTQLPNEPLTTTAGGSCWDEHPGTKGSSDPNLENTMDWDEAACLARCEEIPTCIAVQHAYWGKCLIKEVLRITAESADTWPASYTPCATRGCHVPHISKFKADMAAGPLTPPHGFAPDRHRLSPSGCSWACRNEAGCGGFEMSSAGHCLLKGALVDSVAEIGSTLYVPCGESLPGLTTTPEASSSSAPERTTTLVKPTTLTSTSSSTLTSTSTTSLTSTSTSTKTSTSTSTSTLTSTTTSTFASTSTSTLTSTSTSTLTSTSTSTLTSTSTSTMTSTSTSTMTSTTTSTLTSTSTSTLTSTSTSTLTSTSTSTLTSTTTSTMTSTSTSTLTSTSTSTLTSTSTSTLTSTTTSTLTSTSTSTLTSTSTSTLTSTSTSTKTSTSTSTLTSTSTSTLTSTSTSTSTLTSTSTSTMTSTSTSTLTSTSTSTLTSTSTSTLTLTSTSTSTLTSTSTSTMTSTSTSTLTSTSTSTLTSTSTSTLTSTTTSTLTSTSTSTLTSTSTSTLTSTYTSTITSTSTSTLTSTSTSTLTSTSTSTLTSTSTSTLTSTTTSTLTSTSTSTLTSSSTSTLTSTSTSTLTSTSTSTLTSTYTSTLTSTSTSTLTSTSTSALTSTYTSTITSTSTSTLTSTSTSTLTSTTTSTLAATSTSTLTSTSTSTLTSTSTSTMTSTTTSTLTSTSTSTLTSTTTSTMTPTFTSTLTSTSIFTLTSTSTSTSEMGSNISKTTSISRKPLSVDATTSRLETSSVVTGDIIDPTSGHEEAGKLSEEAINHLQSALGIPNLSPSLIQELQNNNSYPLLDFMNTNDVYPSSSALSSLRDSDSIPPTLANDIEEWTEGQVSPTAQVEISKLAGAQVPKDVIDAVEETDDVKPLTDWLAERETEPTRKDLAPLREQIQPELFEQLETWSRRPKLTPSGLAEVERMLGASLPPPVLASVKTGDYAPLSDWLEEAGVATSKRDYARLQAGRRQWQVPASLMDALDDWYSSALLRGAVKALDAFAGTDVPKAVLDALREGEEQELLAFLDEGGVVPSQGAFEALRSKATSVRLSDELVAALEEWYAAKGMVFTSTEAPSTPTAAPRTLGPGETTTPTFPLSDTEAVVTDVMQTMGCAALLGIVAGTLVLYTAVIRDGSVERFLHANQEAALFLGHLLVISMRARTENHISCKLASMGLQFFFMANFAFLLFEALQAFAIATNVTQCDGLFTKPQFAVMGWAGAGLWTGVSAMLSHQHYVSAWSCWLNLGHTAAMSTFVPVALLSGAAIVLVEAAGMGEWPALSEASHEQRTAAVANQKGLLFTVPLNIGSWFVGLYAVYSANVALYGVVFALNLALAIAIFAFHTLGNPKVHAMVKRWLGRK